MSPGHRGSLWHRGTIGILLLQSFNTELSWEQMPPKSRRTHLKKLKSMVEYLSWIRPQHAQRKWDACNRKKQGSETGTEHPCLRDESLVPLLAGSQKSRGCDDRTRGDSQLGLAHTCIFIRSGGWSQPGRGMPAARMLNSRTACLGYQSLRLQLGCPSWQLQPGNQPKFCPKFPENGLCLPMAFTKEDFLVLGCAWPL